MSSVNETFPEHYLLNDNFSLLNCIHIKLNLQTDLVISS